MDEDTPSMRKFWNIDLLVEVDSSGIGKNFDRSWF
jgi:hypothetical protein